MSDRIKKINIDTNKKRNIAMGIKGILFIFIPIVSFLLMEFYEHNPFIEVRSEAKLFNVVLFELISWILFFLCGSMKWALRIELVMAMVFGLVNHYVMLFRSTPFVPWDIFSVKTAASVAGEYDFTPSARVIIVTLIFILIILMVHFVDLKINLKIYFRIIPVILISILLVIFGSKLQDENFQTRHYLYPFLFTPTYMTNVNGMAVTFTMNLAYVAVEKPKGYDATEVKEELDKYSKESNNEKNTNYPNIIVIMDEAFSDLSVLGNLDTNVDYMPFIHSLQKGYDNTVTGKLNVSVCGGNTANSEFEFLTGNTMAFLPNGSIPYQQYIKEETPSLASYLADLGYSTYAQHPYYSSGWNRDKVYPLLGFENLSFIEDYYEPSIVRKYISDESSFDKIIDTFEEKEENKPAFIFNVTMQNHGGYTDEYYNLTNSVSTINCNSNALNQYLTLIQKTDSDIESLVNYFKTVDEDTVIVFFGDHQPSNAVASSVLNANGIDVNNMSDEQQKLRYEVPYFIWANYDIESKTDADTSINYLAAQVLDVVGVKTSDYQNFLLELKNDYPVITATDVETTNQNEDLFNLYKKFQYYRLFDWEGESNE